MKQRTIQAAQCVTFLRLMLLTTVQLMLAGFAHSATVTLVHDDLAVRKSIKSWTEYRDESLVKQKYDYSCGSAALATVLKYFYREDITERDVLDRLLAQNNNREVVAFSFQDLKNYANSKGYKAIALALPIASLRQLRIPAILYVEARDYEHFTVFKGIQGDFVYLADPSFGNTSARIARFRESFYTRSDLKYPGKALVLIPKNGRGERAVNYSFMNTPAAPGFVYEAIGTRAVVTQVKNLRVHSLSVRLP